MRMEKIITSYLEFVLKVPRYFYPESLLSWLMATNDYGVIKA